MNKNDLILAIMEKVGLGRADASAALDTVFSEIEEAVKSGEVVKVRGFGSFAAVRRKARNGYNIHTRRVVKLPEKNIPKFSPGKNLVQSAKKAAVKFYEDGSPYPPVEGAEAKAKTPPKPERRPEPRPERPVDRKKKRDEFDVEFGTSVSTQPMDRAKAPEPTPTEPKAPPAPEPPAQEEPPGLEQPVPTQKLDQGGADLDFGDLLSDEPAKPEPTPEPEPEVVEEEPKPDFSKDPGHKKAVRVVRAFLSDLNLYHKDRIEKAREAGNFFKVFEKEIKNMRDTYEQRIPESVRQERDYLTEMLNDFAKKQ